MKNASKLESCTFCAKFTTYTSSKNSREWYDVPVIKSEDFLAVPTLGQLVPGYLLVITRRHVLSMAQLTPHEITCLREFCSQVARVQAELWDWPITFEHGICKEDKPAGACINHAHWHMVPGHLDLLAPNTLMGKTIESFQSFAEQEGRNKPYLYYEDKQNKAYVFDGENVPGQYFRRFLARAIGRPNEWDYTVFPFFDNIRQTYRLFETKISLLG